MFHQERELWSSNLRWPFKVGFSLWPNIASVKTDNLDLTQNVCWRKLVWQPKFPLCSPLKGGAVYPARWVVQVEGGSIFEVRRVVSDHLCPVKVASPGGDQLMAVVSAQCVFVLCLFVTFLRVKGGLIGRSVVSFAWQACPHNVSPPIAGWCRETRSDCCKKWRHKSWVRRTKRVEVGVI